MSSSPIEDEPERNKSLRVIADQVVSEEQPANIDTVPIAPLTSQQLLVHDTVTGLPVHVKEAVNKFVLERLTAKPEGVDDLLSVVLETSVIRTIYMVVNSPEFIRRFLGGIIDNLGFIAPVAALVKLEQQKLVTKQAKIEDTCRQIVEAGAKIEPHPVPVTSEGSDWPPANIYDDRANPWAYSLQHSQ